MSNVFMNDASTTDAEAIDDAASEADDLLANLLCLKLKRPKGWRWELSTSRSCANIALPRILLYNHKGELLVDANSQQEQVYQQPVIQTAPKTTPKAGQKHKLSKLPKRSFTASLESIPHQPLHSEFDALEIQEATPSPERFSRQTSQASSRPSIILQANELSDQPSSNSSSKGVRFMVEELHELDESLPNAALLLAANLPTPPSTTVTTTNSSSSGPREKRRYRRSQSSLSGGARSSSQRSSQRSQSILERLSLSRGRHSSPEQEVEQQELVRRPHYFLRSSKAGTLVVQEDSFRLYRRRRCPKPHSCSSENLLDTDCKTALNAMSKGDSMRQFDEETQQLKKDKCLSPPGEQVPRKILPVRRYRSDGNVLLERHPSSSSSDLDVQYDLDSLDGARERRAAQWRRNDYRRQNKAGLVTIDPGNEIISPSERATAR